MRLNLWRTDSTKIRYCDEKGAELAATIDIQMPVLIGNSNIRVCRNRSEHTHAGGLNRMVQVDMNFGLTYIKVEAFDITSGNRVSTKVNFLDKEPVSIAPAVKATV